MPAGQVAAAAGTLELQDAWVDMDARRSFDEASRSQAPRANLEVQEASAAGEFEAGQPCKQGALYIMVYIRTRYIQSSLGRLLPEAFRAERERQV